MTDYKKLDPHVRDVWTAALRSGDFVQGKKQLGKKPSSQGQPEFCCLGVLAVSTPEVSKALWKEDTLTVPDSYYNEGFSEISMIPEWLENIYNLDEDAQTVLIEMNDSGRSFDDIATWIDENLGWGHNPNGHDWPMPDSAPTLADDENLVAPIDG